MRLHDKIGFNASLVAHIVEPWRLSVIKLRLKRLHDNQILKQSACQRISRDLLRRLDLEEVRREPDVGKVDLGRLDESLAEVVVVRMKTIDDETFLKDGQPLLECGCADAHFARQPVHVDDLSDTLRQQTQEQFEAALVRDVDELSDVVLHVGAVIALIGVNGILNPVVNRREEPFEDIAVTLHPNAGVSQFRN